jgi:hypothetical protein
MVIQTRLASAASISALLIGDCEAEIEMADRAVAPNPNSFHAWNCRGWVYKIAPEEAIRSFERAMRMSPVDPQLYTRRDLRVGRCQISHRSSAIWPILPLHRSASSNSTRWGASKRRGSSAIIEPKRHPSARRPQQTLPSLTTLSLPKTRNLTPPAFGHCARRKQSRPASEVG